MLLSLPEVADVPWEKSDGKLAGRVLWFSLVMVILVTMGYFIFLAIPGFLMQRRRHLDDSEPAVSLIIAAYNEEGSIARKLDNTLSLDYPRERLEIIVASDGSTDRTGEIVRSFGDQDVLLRRFPGTGKRGVQNQVVRTAKEDILVFSDANAFYRPEAMRKLVRDFADPEVACVSSQLVYEVDREGAGDCDRSYWNYETFIKRRESDLSSLIGANGSIYAVHRWDYVEIGNDLISDLEPLALVRRGRQVVQEPKAICTEGHAVEFRRKVRILTQSIQGLLQMGALLKVAFCLALLSSHGILGAAVGTAIPELIASLVAIPSLITRCVGVPLGQYARQAFLPPVASVIPAVVVVFALKTIAPPTSRGVLVAEVAAGLLILWRRGRTLVPRRASEDSGGPGHEWRPAEGELVGPFADTMLPGARSNNPT